MRENTAAFWLTFMVAAPSSACGITTTQVGSACPNGQCADASVEPRGLPCAVGTVEGQLGMSPVSDADAGPYCDNERPPRRDDGTIACRLMFERPTAGATVEACNALGGTQVTRGVSANPSCELPQVRFLGEHSEPGWYYDDFSPQVRSECSAAGRVALTDRVPLGPDARFFLDCDQAYAKPFDNAGIMDDEVPVLVTPNICASARDLGPAVIDVGQPCTPTLVPADGYRSSEIFIETASADCSTGACMIYGLEGGIGGNCGDANCLLSGACASLCANIDAIDRNVYCTCRCADEPGVGPLCDCPAGFFCRKTLHTGPAAGSYCVSEYNLTFDLLSP